MRPAAHCVPQTPAEQTCPVVHAFAHLPQFATSVWRSTQPPPQSIVGALQARAQRPALQTRPMPHAVPHAPQFFGSEDVSTHAPAQSVPVAQAHALPAHA
jgi:hypothetical protein